MFMAKYVVIEEEPNTTTIIVFSAWKSHKSIECTGKIISAGFVNIKNKSCFGSSTSLKIKSNPIKDNALLRILLGD